jgi:hypothetical protein
MINTCKGPAYPLWTPTSPTCLHGEAEAVELATKGGKVGQAKGTTLAVGEPMINLGGVVQCPTYDATRHQRFEMDTWECWVVLGWSMPFRVLEDRYGRSQLNREGYVWGRLFEHLCQYPKPMFLLSLCNSNQQRLQLQVMVSP